MTKQKSNMKKTDLRVILNPNKERRIFDQLKGIRNRSEILRIATTE